MLSQTTSRLAALLVLGVAVAVSPARAAQSDHLKGYKVKDLNKIQPPASNTVVDAFGSGTCALKKAMFMLVPASKDNGDDPRGGAAGAFVCYKAKCDAALPPTTAADTQFGALSLETKKAQLVCLPAGLDLPVCGDNNIDPGEQCDGTALGTCGGTCLPDCTCGPYCGDNIKNGTEQCDGTDSTACPGICHADCTCGVACAGTSPPACTGGECPAGQMCGNGLLSCGCIPIGSQACVDSSPTCGGACPIGQTCAETVPSSGFCGCL